MKSFAGAPLLLVGGLLLAICACGAPVGMAPEAGEPLPTLTAAPAAEAPAPGEPEDGAQPTPEPVVEVSPVPASLESRRVTLEFPSQIRLGDSDIVRLTLEVDELFGLTPTAQVAGNVVQGETVQIPSLYETHNVIAEARLDMAGVEISPPGTTSEPLLPGQSVTFFWSVRTEAGGTYRGTVWLHLRFVDKVSGAESRRAVSAQQIELQAVNFLGMSAGVARGLGAVGSVLGGILGIPFLEEIVRTFFRRRKT
jgi:hypothetical protein